MAEALLAVLFVAALLAAASAEETFVFKGQGGAWTIANSLYSSRITMVGQGSGSQGQCDELKVAAEQGHFIIKISVSLDAFNGGGDILCYMHLQAKGASCKIGREGCGYRNDETYFTKGEVIKTMTLHGGQRVDGFQYTTNKNPQVRTIGGTGGSSDAVNVLSGVLAGAIYRAGAQVDALAFLFLDAVKGYEISNVQWNIEDLPVSEPAIKILVVNNTFHSIQVTQTQTYEVQTGSSLTTTLSEDSSYNTDWSLTASAGFSIPFVGDGSVSASVGGGWSSADSKSSETASNTLDTVTKNVEITCPPFTYCTTKVETWTGDAVALPFTATGTLKLINSREFKSTITGSMAIKSVSKEVTTNADYYANGSAVTGTVRMPTLL